MEICFGGFIVFLLNTQNVRRIDVHCIIYTKHIKGLFIIFTKHIKGFTEQGNIYLYFLLSYFNSSLGIQYLPIHHVNIPFGNHSLLVSKNE